MKVRIPGTPASKMDIFESFLTTLKTTIFFGVGRAVLNMLRTKIIPSNYVRLVYFTDTQGTLLK